MWAIAILFLLSGFAGLAYEVVWFKRFALMWGNSTLAVAAVVGAFLFGLGLGAYLFGKVADRVTAPLLWYGVLEIAIGVLAAAIPYETAWAWSAASALYVRLEAFPLVHSLARCGLTFLVIGPPCVLMGGTLPLLARQVTPPHRLLGEWVGLLYGINTIGAALGCYVTGFHLLPAFGLGWSNRIAVAVSLSTGIAAIILARYIRTPSPAGPTSVSSAARLETTGVPVSYPASVLYFSAAATGAGALALQVIWTRQLALVLGSSVYAFSAMLLVVLTGMGVGSLLVHCLLHRRAVPYYAPAMIVVSLALTALVGKLMLVNLTRLVGANRSLRSNQLFDTALSLSSSAVLELLPAVAMGVLFPLLVHLTRHTGKRAGHGVGIIYAWNTFGAIAGATLTALVLVPRMGLDRSFAVVMFVYVLAAWILVPLRKRSDYWVLVGVAAVGCLVVWASIQRADPRITNVGMYLYGYDGGTDRDSVLYFREGASCNVLVTRGEGGNVGLRVNGKVDASSQGDMAMQLGLAYFPRFVMPDVQDVLVIGFGSGTTSGASLLFADTRITCCEIEPAVFSASRFFSEVNHSPQDSPNFSIVFDDGRTFVQGTSQQFDLILSEPSNPWMAGVANLFTREFYESAAERLSTDGMLAQWVQTYDLSAADYAMALRTVCSVFPHVALVRISQADTILFAKKRPISWDRRTTKVAQQLVDANPVIRSDLEKHFGSTDVASLLMQFAFLDEAGVRRLLEADVHSTINTDQNLRLEFSAPLRLYALRDRHEVDASILRAVDPLWFDELSHRLGAESPAAAFNNLALLFARRERKHMARRLVELGLGNKADAGLLATRLALAGADDWEVFEDTMQLARRLPADEAAQVGVAFWQSNRYQHAVEVFQRLVTDYPESATMWANLAVNHQALGNREKALEAFSKAEALDPFCAFVDSARSTIGKANPSAANSGSALGPNVESAP